MQIDKMSIKESAQPENNSGFIFTVLISYVALLLTGILLHPMWRDEIHFWSISGASSGLGDLLQRKEWDGHPDLWYILVYAVRSLFDNPVAMQLMHAGIALTTVFLILKYAPFPKVQRALLVFGYFFLFEYAMISRNYAIGILLITLILVLYPQRTRYIFLIALIMFLLVQTNMFSIILCMAFLLTWGFEFIFSKTFRTELLRKKATVAISIILVLAGIVYSLQTVIPPPAPNPSGVMDFSLSQLTLQELIRSVATVWKAWVPVPELTSQFWNTNMVGSDVIEAILALIMLFAAALLFIKRPVVLFLYTIGMAGIIGFIFIIFYGYLRHHGHLFLLLVICLWLKEFYQEQQLDSHPYFPEKIYQWMKRNSAHLVTFLLLIHVLAGMYAFVIQIVTPFSAGKETARYIRQEKLDRYLMAGDRDISLETVTSYLDQEAFYFGRKSFSRYLNYNPNLRHRPDESAIMMMADSLMRVNGDTILLVMNSPLTEARWVNLKRLQSFEQSIVADEVYYLYLLSPHPQLYKSPEEIK